MLRPEDQRPRCGGCGSGARIKDRPDVELVDLPVLGRPAQLGGANTAGNALKDHVRWGRGLGRTQGSLRPGWE